MKNLENILSEKELKTRDRWLLWVIIIPFIIYLMLLFGALFITFSAIVSAIAAGKPEIILFLCAGLGLVIFTGLVGYYVPYRCCYRGHGTAWLTFMIVGISLSTALNIFAFTIGLKDTNLIATTTSTLISLFFIYLSVKLLKVNKKIRNISVHESENYKKAIAAFESTTTIHECAQIRDTQIEALSTFQERDKVLRAYKEYTAKFK